jgi:diacylglycerol kinase
MRHQISFIHAWDGLAHTFKTQPNLRIHLFVALLVACLGIFLEIDSRDWLILLFTIMWVITAEMANTAVESVVDLISKDYSLEAKIAKDVSAGLVLVGAMGSVVVGLVIFIPYIF